MADMRFLAGSGRFVCIGLGSCIGVAALDPMTRVGGMLHIMLPEAPREPALDKPGKFANTGLPVFVEKLEREGANRRRLRIALAGGAQMFRFGPDRGAPIGERNLVAVKGALRDLGLRPLAEDTGGQRGRTMTMDVETGEIRLRTTGTEERRLCSLAS